MPRDTLLDFFEDFGKLRDTFIIHDDGYRVRRVTYREMAAAARVFAARLSAAGVGPDDKVVVWSENRPEWIIAFWGCLLCQVVVVPVDYRASADLLERICAIVRAKVVLVGNHVEAPPTLDAPIWKLADIPPAEAGSVPPAMPRRVGAPATAATLAEIIFTSGATADPKGVTITHRNILANLVPIEREIQKYRKYEWPFHPVRFLNLLPLSHMFGQSMATFIPPLLRGTVVFSHGYSPAEIIRQIKSRRMSVLVSVPKVLDVLREHIMRLCPETAGPDLALGRHWTTRWWIYRKVHRLFGWKFWCIVVGAAPLDPQLETFWRTLGFIVVQGYGLTETAPIVTLNHPFRASKGTVGKPIAGVDVKIAEDGEILVRGDNVTSGYFDPNATTNGATAPVFQDGWFHTGDIGEVDEAGQLSIKGRKKEMIATAQGLNVFPEDVERALLAQPGVRDAGVIGLSVNGEERVHAVLVVTPGTNTDDVVRGANATLEDHQRVWSVAVWPGEALPRTEGTQKLKRRELHRWASGATGSGPSPASAGATVIDVVRRFATGRDLKPETTLDELGLSSLDRVELLMALEDTFHTTLDESMLAIMKTLADLQAAVGAGPATPAGGSSQSPPEAGVRAPGGGQSNARVTAPMKFPSWNRTWPARVARRLSLPTWILPLARPFMKLEVRGLDNLRGLQGPVVFAPNHQSFMDGPVILTALTPEWRYRVAPAMAKELFEGKFGGPRTGVLKWAGSNLEYYLTCLFFNAFPLPQREAGTRETLRYIGEVTGDGYSILIFPEGTRTQTGAIAAFRPGVGMIGARLGLPVVPIKLEGLDKVLGRGMHFPKRGPVRVTFGKPMSLTGEDYSALAKQVEDAVRKL